MRAAGVNATVERWRLMKMYFKLGIAVEVSDESLPARIPISAM
jgi:hypothetical protein